MSPQRKSILKALSKASQLARTREVKGFGSLTFINRVRWQGADASDFAEGYGDIVEAYWNGFALDVREGRYLQVKRLQESLRKRTSKNDIGHATEVAALRLSILENVLLHYEVYGYAPTWDELGPAQQDEQLGRNHERRVKLGKALKERREQDGLFETYGDFKKWAGNVVNKSESQAKNIIGPLWVLGKPGRKGGAGLRKMQNDLIGYAEEAGSSEKSRGKE